jgi:aspartate-semialdehyde dehydrogenase
MDRQFAVAVVGATGLVGEMMINVLEERSFPVAELFPLASERSIGRSVSFRGRSYPVNELAGFDFAQWSRASTPRALRLPAASSSITPRSFATRTQSHS